MKIYPLLLLLLISLGYAQDAHVRAVARPGEGVISLLKLYQMHEYNCNYAYFYEINDMSEDDFLFVNKTYDLPIMVYNYNGKSIRSTIGITDRPQAERIQAFNEAMQAANLRKDDYREDNILWVPYHEIHCPNARKEQAAVKATEGEYPLRGSFDIFGEGYADVPHIDDQLKGSIYYVVSGHGGPDPGAVGKKDGKLLCEDEYAYDISLRLARKLLAHGATVYIIIRDPNDGIRSDKYLPEDKDERCWPNQWIYRNQKNRLEQRSDAVNKLYLQHKKGGAKHQRLVVLHIDSDNQVERLDMRFFFSQSSADGRALAKLLQQTIKKKYEQYRKGRGFWGKTQARDLHMLRETFPTTVFIELGNIKNPVDQLRFLLESNRELIADWLCDGLIAEKKQVESKLIAEEKEE